MRKPRTSQMRDLLHKVPLYSRLLREYPKADIHRA